jgi:hypothetical protein
VRKLIARLSVAVKLAVNSHAHMLWRARRRPDTTKERFLAAGVECSRKEDTIRCQSVTNKLASSERLSAAAASLRAGSRLYEVMGTPLYAALCARGADDPDILELVSNAREGAAPMHLLFSVHYLLLQDPGDPLSSSQHLIQVPSRQKMRFPTSSADRGRVGAADAPLTLPLAVIGGRPLRIPRIVRARQLGNSEAMAWLASNGKDVPTGLIDYIND